MDAAAAGDEIVVTNGIYAEGGRAVYGTMTNRVVVTNAVLLRSVNGPELTIIQGLQVVGYGYGNGAVRCAYVANGALLAGFTLTNGATRGWTDDNRDESGGGVWCESGVVSNCVIAGNTAYSLASGVFGGTFVQCTITGNLGRGADSATLINCHISTNTAGGVANCTLTNCTLSGNHNP
ncbi:MAG: hypothetical protein ACREIC_25395, partial [Limisphaerales bacterium]